LTALLDEGPEDGIIQVVDVSCLGAQERIRRFFSVRATPGLTTAFELTIGLAPGEIVSDLFFRWVLYDSTIERRWILELVIW
jgi:hypothetical protein